MLVTVYTNGQIMLPAEIRLQLDIKAGDSLSFFINDGKEIIMCKTACVQKILQAQSSKNGKRLNLFANRRNRSPRKACSLPIDKTQKCKAP